MIDIASILSTTNLPSNAIFLNLKILGVGYNASYIMDYHVLIITIQNYNAYEVQLFYNYKDWAPQQWNVLAGY
jgi:hypothetical protein